MHASEMLEHSRNALLEHSTASKEVLEHNRNALKCTCKILEYSIEMHAKVSKKVMTLRGKNAGVQ